MVQLVKLDDLSVVFNQHKVLDGINLTLNAGEITTLLGPNGAGKSTLVKVILQLLPPSSGHLWRKTRLRVGYVPQKLQLDPTLPLSVERFLKLARGARAAHIEAEIARLRLETLRRRQMRQLSGGEMQRVLLARALLARPQLLVLDEPAQGMDIHGQAELYQLVNTLARALGCAVFMVSHDLHLVMASTDHVICLNHHICCEGEPESVANHPEFARLFGRRERNALAVYTHHHHCDHQHTDED